MRSASRALIYRVPRECERCPACGSSTALRARPAAASTSGPRLPHRFCERVRRLRARVQQSATDSRGTGRFYSPEGEWGSRRASRVTGRAHEATPRRGRRSRAARSWSRAFDPIRDKLSVTSPPDGRQGARFRVRRRKAARRASGVRVGDVGHRDRRGRGVSAAPPARRRFRTSPTFDLIVANHVFEHVTDPLGLLRQFARACRVGGYLHRWRAALRHAADPSRLQVRHQRARARDRVHLAMPRRACSRAPGWKPVAPPPDRLSKGQGPPHVRAAARAGAARRASTCEPPPSPAHAARTAIRRYHADIEGRPLLERLGLYRLAARRAEARRAGIRHTQSEKGVGSHLSRTLARPP